MGAVATGGVLVLTINFVNVLAPPSLHRASARGPVNGKSPLGVAPYRQLGPSAA